MHARYKETRQYTQSAAEPQPYELVAVSESLAVAVESGIAFSSSTFCSLICPRYCVTNPLHGAQSFLRS
jgi:hypothetical protein